MSKFSMFRRMFHPKSFGLPLWILHPFAAGIVIDPSGSLIKELVPFDDLSYGRFGDRRDMRLFTALVDKGLKFLFAHPGVLLPHLSDTFDNQGIYSHPSDSYRPCRTGDQRLKMPVIYREPPLPYMDEFPVHPEGFFGRLLPIGVIKPQYPMPLLGNFIFAEPLKAMEHLFNPPIASYPTKYPVSPGIMIHLYVNVENVS